MEKFYVNEVRPSGEISTVGLFYFQEEAEEVVQGLRSLPEKKGCRYEITEQPPLLPSRDPRGKDHQLESK